MQNGSNPSLHVNCKIVKIKIIKEFMATMNFNVLHLLYFLKEQRLHFHAGPKCCFMYFLKFEKSVSVEEFQMRGSRVININY